MRHQLPEVASEDAKDSKLMRCEMHTFAVDANVSLLEIDLESVEVNDILAGGTYTPENGPQPREELVQADRLRHVVIGPGVERGDLLLLVPDGGEDDYRRGAPRA